MKPAVLLAFCAFVLPVSAVRAEPMRLVADGRARCTLVVPEEASEQNRAAAELLGSYVGQSTGGKLVIETESDSDPNRPRVHVGGTGFARAACPDLDRLDDDGFVLSPVDEKNLVIAGPTDWGTEFGVCAFLERFVGVRWLLPGPHGTFVPKKKDVIGPNERIRQEPVAFSRLFGGLRGDVQQTWARRNRMHGRVSFHHNLLRLFPPSRYGKTHPEFFPIHNGKRYIPANDALHGWQPCFSAPGIVDEAVKTIKAYFKAHPEATSYSLGVTDSAGHCQCEACAAQDPGTDNVIGIRDVSDRYFAWCNKVVTGVLEEFPDKWFGCLAYRQVFEPPTKTPIHPRIIAYVTYDRMKWADGDQRGKGHELTERWQRACPTLGWYEYLRFSSPDYLRAVTPEMIQQSEDRLRAALAKAKTKDQRARAELLLRAFEYYQTSALAYLGSRKVGVEDITTEKDVLGLLDDAPSAIRMAGRRLELVDAFAADPVLVHPLPPTRYPLLAGLSSWSVATLWGLYPWVERSEGVRSGLEALCRSDSPAVAREARTMLQFAAGKQRLISRNPGFEAGQNDSADDWSFWVASTGTLKRTDDVKRAGDWSVVAEGFARGGPYQVLPVTPGRYVGVCQVYVPPGQESRGTVELAIIMRDAEGTNLDEAKTSITPAPGNWVALTSVLDVTAASRGKNVTHVLFCPIINGFRRGQRVYIDECRLFRLSE